MSGATDRGPIGAKHVKICDIFYYAKHVTGA